MLTVEEIRKVVAEIAPKYSLKKVNLFGSRANGTFHEDSDIDLIVEFAKNKIVTLMDLSGLKIDLEENFGVSVDVVTRGGLKNSFLEIEKEIEIYAA